MPGLTLIGECKGTRFDFCQHGLPQVCQCKHADDGWQPATTIKCSTYLEFATASPEQGLENADSIVIVGGSLR